MEEERKQFQPLSARIWITRKARIRAECRLLHYRFLAKWALVLYPLASAILAIGILVLSVEKIAEWVSATIAVILLPVLALISAQRFGERAILMRVCYTRLARLCEQAGMAETAGDSLTLEKISEDYQSILALTENHTEYDHFENGEQKGKLNFWQILRFCCYPYLAIVFWGAVAMVLPIAIVVVFFVYMY